MENKLGCIYSCLNEVLPNNVYYALQVKEKLDIPFIVYQEINKRSIKFHDDKSFMKLVTIQISLVTRNKDIELEKKLENKLDAMGIEYQMVSEFYLKDSGLYRVYEIKMEEFKYE